MRIKDKVNPLNIPHWICYHLLGQHHTVGHRVFVGILVMFVGVYTSKIHFEYIVFHYAVDCVGYAIHGIGAIPIVEYLIDTHQKDKEEEKHEERDG